MENYSVNNSDEIDLKELLLAFWEGKWFVASFVVISFIVSIAFIIIKNDSFKSSIEIRGINQSEVDRYSRINNSGVIKIDSDMLLSRFIEELNNKELIYNVFNDVYNEIKFDSEIDKNNFIVEKSKNLVLDEVLNGNKNNPVVQYYSLNYKGNDIEAYEQIASNLLLKATEEIHEDLKYYVESEINRLELERKHSLEDIEQKIENLKILYSEQKESRLAFLREQSTIAHTLGIANNSISGQSISVAGGSLAAIEREAPEYLRGYQAIDKEIELIESRSEEKNFISGLPELLAKYDAIKRDMKIDRIKEDFKSSPLSSAAEFSAASFDLNDINYENQVKSSLVMALSLILGFMLGIFALMIRNVVKK
jgi:LPS O-antigen subunit length determinant protein (WzzB/FepE family)